MKLLAGVFLGWSLGANNAATVFGTAVSSQMVRWRTAAALMAAGATAGALLQGAPGLETYSRLVANQTALTAFCAAAAAALAATAMTCLGLPVSISQAVVGGMLGIGLRLGQTNFHGLDKVVLCWLGTPFGAALLAALLYPLLARLVRLARPHFLVYDQMMRILLLGAGIYGSYALGANNAANVAGVFYAAGMFRNGLLPESVPALLLAGAAISLGALTYSRKVMRTVGGGITELDAFSAFIAVLAQALTVHAYAALGAPVSASQAVVGAVLGIGLLKGMHTVRKAVLVKILLGWVVTPLAGGFAAWGLFGLLR